MFNPPSSQYKGVKSVNFFGAITTPPACLPAFLTKPSRDFARSIIERTSSSSWFIFSNSLSLRRAFSKVIPTSNGISFAILSTNP